MRSRKPNPAYDTIEALADMFPACFSVFQGRRKPLKVGILNDLLAAMAGAATAKELGLALRRDRILSADMARRLAENSIT